MRRLTREDWFTHGLRLLSEAGAPSLTIDQLARALQVTKGSFYHHFADFAAFKTALLAFYEHVSTQEVIATLEQEPTPGAKLHRLFAIAVLAPSAIERGIRVWSFQDPQARDVQARIDAQRVAYVQALCGAICAEAQPAALMGQLAYVILVGAQQVQPPLAPQTIRALFDEFRRLYQLE